MRIYSQKELDQLFEKWWSSKAFMLQGYPFLKVHIKIAWFAGFQTASDHWGEKIEFLENQIGDFLKIIDDLKSEG